MALTVRFEDRSVGQSITVIEGDAGDDADGVLDEIIRTIRDLATENDMRLDLTKLRGLSPEHVARLVEGVESSVDIVGLPGSGASTSGDESEG